MRQIGFICAAALVALKENVGKLEGDHKKAKVLAGQSATLPWSTRMKIALGASKGLACVHGADKLLIYRDFKSSNILLDFDYNCKLSDFGLAKGDPEGGETQVTTRVMGTQGYVAPEYIMTGHLTTMSDVYSFEIVLLKLLTGK